MPDFVGCDPSLLREFLRESGLKFEEHAKSYVFTCPRCQKKRKLYIRKSDGRFVCWYCKETDNYQGRPEYALADLLGVSVRQVSTRLYGEGNAQVDLFLDLRVTDFFGDDEEVDADASPPPLLTWPFDYHPIEAPESARGAEYLRGRGVPLWVAKQYGIRYCPPRRRVVFPVQSHGALLGWHDPEEGMVHGWQERTVLPHKFLDQEGNEREIPKILSSTGIPRERTLMFADRLTGSDHAVLAEGPIDAIKAHFCGGNVSPMGKAVSPGQMKLLLRAGVKRIYLGLDPDAAEETQRLVRDHFDDVELYTMAARVKGAEEKPDLGAMDFADVYELFLGAPRVFAGQLFVFLDPKVA